MQGRQQGFGEYTNLRNFLFGKYNANRSFDYNAYLNDYQRKLNEYQQNQNMVGLGQWGAGNQANILQNQGATLSNIDVMRGNVASGEIAGKSAAMSQLFAGFDPLGQILGTGGTGALGSLASMYPAQTTTGASAGGAPTGGMDAGNPAPEYQTDYNTYTPTPQPEEESGMSLGSLIGLIASIV
jgi:hypothetical protein